MFYFGNDRTASAGLLFVRGTCRISLDWPLTQFGFIGHCANHWEFLRFWTGFELSSSWRRLSCYGASTNRSDFCVMGLPQIDLGAQDSNGIQRPKNQNM
jgi:hypothetical protein